MDTLEEIVSSFLVMQPQVPEEYSDSAAVNEEAMIVDADAEPLIDEPMNDEASAHPPTEPIEVSKIEATQAHVQEVAITSPVSKSMEDASESEASIFVNKTRTPVKVRAKFQRKVMGSTPPTRRSDRLIVQAKASSSHKKKKSI